jgi:hypothetical protein
MADEIVYTGTAENSDNGDLLRVAMQKINAEFAKISAMLTDRGAWATGVVYNKLDKFTQGGNVYVVGVTHTSGVFATDLAAGKFGLSDSFTLRNDLAGAGAGQGAKIVGYGLSTVESKLNEIYAISSQVLAAGSADNTAAIQAALNSGFKYIDFLNLPLSSNAITVPSGVTVYNLNLTKKTAGGNLLQVSSNVRVFGKLTGTGTVSIVERLIYPAHNAANDVHVDVTLKNATVGLQAQPLAGTASVDAPKRWTGIVRCENMVGTPGASEGYGVLCSPAEDFDMTVYGVNIRRHALYLSAGASGNNIETHVDGCGNYAVQLFSSTGQRATANNTVTIKSKNLTNDVATQSGPLAIVGLCVGNDIKLNHTCSGFEKGVVLIEGSSSPSTDFPKRNTIKGAITGFLAVGSNDAVRLLNEELTDISGLSVEVGNCIAAVAIRVSGTHPAQHAATSRSQYVKTLTDAYPVYIEAIGIPCVVDDTIAVVTGSSLRIRDDSVGQRKGSSKKFAKTYTTPSVAANSSVDFVVTLPYPIYASTRLQKASIYQAFSAVGASYSLQIFNISDTQLTVRCFNGHSAAQTLTFLLEVQGD